VNAEEEAEREGAEDADRGYRRDQNPYAADGPRDSLRKRAWLRGWEKAKSARRRGRVR
jgi:hypothetical protein